VLRAALPLWWAAIAAFDGVQSGPRTIAALLTAYPDDFLLVALPDTYLAAVADDVTEAVREIDRPERFAVLSVGGAAVPGLEEYHLPAEARLSRIAGGSLAALNARLCHLLVTRLGDRPLTRSRCRQQLAGWLAETREVSVPSRTPLTDGELRAVIRRFLSSDPDASPTSLLRRLRESGRACEQSRFLTLCRQMKGDRHARA
jgi:hypothetical protein